MQGKWADAIYKQGLFLIRISNKKVNLVVEEGYNNEFRFIKILRLCQWRMLFKKFILITCFQFYFCFKNKFRKNDLLKLMKLLRKANHPWHIVYFDKTRSDPASIYIFIYSLESIARSSGHYQFCSLASFQLSSIYTL